LVFLQLKPGSVSLFFPGLPRSFRNKMAHDCILQRASTRNNPTVTTLNPFQPLNPNLTSAMHFSRAFISHRVIASPGYGTACCWRVVTCCLEPALGCYVSCRRTSFPALMQCEHADINPKPLSLSRHPYPLLLTDETPIRSVQALLVESPSALFDCDALIKATFNDR
jgi:hypothetical protein